MKIRIGFVSNSSSASFVIDLSSIENEKKKAKIIKNIQSCKYDDQESWVSDFDHWSVNVDGDTIDGFTTMDNYDFSEYILKVFEDVFDENVWKEIHDECVNVKWD